jgi:hypothetical protein
VPARRNPAEGLHDPEREPTAPGAATRLRRPGRSRQWQTDVVIRWWPGGKDTDGDDQPDGYYAHLEEYPEEGALYLDPDRPIDGVDVWRDPDTGRTAPKPQPCSAEEAARALGVGGTPDLADIVRAAEIRVGYLRSENALQRAKVCDELAENIRQLADALGVTPCCPPGEPHSFLCPNGVGVPRHETFSQDTPTDPDKGGK